jgi:hypothetical protein
MWLFYILYSTQNIKKDFIFFTFLMKFSKPKIYLIIFSTTALISGGGTALPI